MKKFLIWIIIPVLFFSCNSADKVPREIIRPEKMKIILWDVMRAQSLAQETSMKDSTLDVATETKILSQKVFKIHKTDSARFVQSYNWYVKHPELLKGIFDSLYNQKQRKNETELKKKEKAAGHPLNNEMK